MAASGSALGSILLTALLVGPISVPGTPSATVRAFYAFHFAHDMAFTPESVRVKNRWLAPVLVDLCESYFRRPASSEEVPEIDGDPFTDSQEYPKRFRVGAARVSGEAARVPVTCIGRTDRRAT
ncbi:MAG TPA: hypothetical protein VF958_00955 [Thermoanaerobaculia bacterium]